MIFESNIKEEFLFNREGSHSHIPQKSRGGRKCCGRTARGKGKNVSIDAIFDHNGFSITVTIALLLLDPRSRDHHRRHQQ
jgi:hypothetical protein